MAQGKAWDKEEVIRTLEPFFKLGCNIKKACSYAGIPYTTVKTWIDDDEELRIKVEAWQNEIATSARRTIKQAVEKGEVAPSLEWLKRKEKDEFSDKIETDITSKGQRLGFGSLKEMSDEELERIAKGSETGTSVA